MFFRWNPTDYVGFPPFLKLVFSLFVVLLQNSYFLNYSVSNSLHSTADGLCCTFYLLRWGFQLQNLWLVFPYDFYPVNTSFWTCLFLWFHCLSEFSCKFLQQQSLCVSDHLDYKIPCLDAWLLKNYLVAMTYFLNFFMLLVLYPCFHIWNSRHLTSLLVAFGWVILLAGTVTWHFLCFYMGIPDLFLVLLRAELLSFSAFDS